MTYGALRDYVLQLINKYSIAGSRVPFGSPRDLCVLWSFGLLWYF